jgi:hypothetical protein
MIRNISMMRCAVGLLGAALLCGCASDGKPSTLPNPDPNLRKTSAELAADAAKRGYEASAPKGGEAIARAQYELMSEQFDVVNLSDTDWTNVELWVNQNYVLFIPAMQRNSDKRVDFQMLFDRDGHHFDTQGGKNPISTLEVFRDGKIYTVPAVQE